jgi:hypothetical protein
MTLRLFLVVIAVALAGFMAMTNEALASRTLRHTYLHLHHRLGDRAGRNIVAHGARLHGHIRPASYHLIAQSIRTMRRMLTPVTVARASPIAPATDAVAAAMPTSSGGMPACTWVPESGGSYTARNASGAGGKYQIMPRTWKAYGGSTANAADATPAEQEAVARRVLAGQGPSAWVNC